MTRCKKHGTTLVDGECLRCAIAAPVRHRCAKCERPAQVMGWAQLWCSAHYLDEQRTRGTMDWRDRMIDERIEHGN